MRYPQVIFPFLSFTTFSFTGPSNPRLPRLPALKKGGIWCIKGRDLVIAGERFGVCQGGIWCGVTYTLCDGESAASGAILRVEHCQVRRTSFPLVAIQTSRGRRSRVARRDDSCRNPFVVCIRQIINSRLSVGTAVAAGSTGTRSARSQACTYYLILQRPAELS